VFAWPYRGPIGLVEQDAERDATDIHVVDNWCYFGTARTDEELASMLESPPRGRFDVDQYKILVKFVAGKSRMKIVELPAFGRPETMDALCTAS